MPVREMLFEGFTEEEILGLPAETVEGLIVLGEPLVFRVGSATVMRAGAKLGHSAPRKRCSAAE